MTPNKPSHLITAVCVAAAPVAAWAHPGLHAEAVTAAFAHPFLGLDHLLAMVAVGAWAAAGTRGAAWAPLAFVTAALLGTLAGAAGIPVPALEVLLGLSVAGGGLVLLQRRSWSARPLVFAACVLGALHGNAHGLEVAGANSLGALGALAAGTALLHVLGYATARGLGRVGPQALRLAGAALALIGGALAIA